MNNVSTSQNNKKRIAEQLSNVSEKQVEFAQNTASGITYIKITKNSNGKYRIASQNGLITCSKCKKQISVSSDKCIFCGTDLQRTLDVYFNLLINKKIAVQNKNSTNDEAVIKKQNIDLFEERHEIFFSKEHRKYLTDLKFSDFKEVMRRSEYIYERKDVLPYFSQSDWMKLMRLSEEDFISEIKKLETKNA